MTRAVRRLRVWLAAAGFVAIVVGCASAVLAQDRDAGEGDDPSGRSAAFQAVEGPTRESISGGTLMLSAYAVVWVLVAGYVARIALSSSRTARDLSRLEAALAKMEREPTPARKGEPASATKGEAEKGS